MLLQLIRTVALWEMLKIVHDLRISTSCSVFLCNSWRMFASVKSFSFFTPYQEVVEGTHGLIFLPLD